MELLREKAVSTPRKYVFRLHMQVDQLEFDLEDKDAKLEIAEDLKVLANNVEKVIVSAVKRDHE